MMFAAALSWIFYAQLLTRLSQGLRPPNIDAPLWVEEKTRYEMRCLVNDKEEDVRLTWGIPHGANVSTHAQETSYDNRSHAYIHTSLAVGMGHRDQNKLALFNCTAAFDVESSTTFHRVLVLVRPSTPAITGPAVVEVGREAMWHCRVAGGFPLPRLSWSLGGRHVRAGVRQHSVPRGDGLLDSDGFLSYTPKSAEAFLLLTCHLSQDEIPGSVRVNFTTKVIPTHHEGFPNHAVQVALVSLLGATEFLLVVAFVIFFSNDQKGLSAFGRIRAKDIIMLVLSTVVICFGVLVWVNNLRSNVRVTENVYFASVVCSVAGLLLVLFVTTFSFIWVFFRFDIYGSMQLSSKVLHGNRKSQDDEIPCHSISADQAV